MPVSDVSISVYCWDVLQGEEKDATALQKEENSSMDSTEENKDSSCDEEISSPTVFVNTRRGRGNGTKRKIPDPEPVTECDAKLPPSTAEVLHIII